MPPLFFPLYYQLLQAYHPVTSLSNPPTITVEKKLIPTVSVLGSKSTYSPPPIGGDGKIVNLALIGDSMIDTLSENICQNSLQKYFPTIKFNLLKYGYGSTNIESVSKRLTETTTYLNNNNPPLLSQNPDIILIESFAYNNFGNSQKGIDRQSQALQNIIDIIQNQSPNTKIILASTIAPNSITFASGIKNIHYSALEKIEETTTIKLYLQNLINFATKNHLPLVDIFHPSLFGQNGLDQFIDSVDYLHPSNLGTELFCDTLGKIILDSQLIN